MSAKPKDQRPKIISFPTTLDGLNIAAKKHVLWPCYAFNISIPQRKKCGLNVFEETVLMLTEIESGETDKLAQLTCLEKDLVTFIQNRLNQLGLLNDRYELSEQGRDLMRERQNKSDGNLEYTAVTVFLDLLSGRFLPYVCTGQLKYKKISKIDDRGFINFLINPTNGEEKVWARKIHFTDAHRKKIPDPNEIIRTIREFRKKYKRHALLNQWVEQAPPAVPMAEAISVHGDPELVYLHCHVLIQIGNPGDLLVTDGCGFGFSESFAGCLISQNLPWITELKKEGIVEKIDIRDSLAKRNSNKTYKYDEVSRRIKKSQDSLSKIKDLKPNSSNYEREYKREIEFGIKNLYESLEWALRQVISDFPVSEWEDIFSGQNFRDNEKLLRGFAQKIGFMVNEKNQSVLQVKAGAIREIERGKVELQPLLALSLAAANGTSRHTMHILAKNDSDFLSFALKLKKYRDPIEHGSTEDLNLNTDTLARLIEDTIFIVTSLVPDVANDLDVESIAFFDRDINQDRLKATIELEKNLGNALLFHLHPDIKEQLLRAEIMLAKYTDDEAIEIIKCYSSAIQQTLLDVTIYNKPSVRNNEKLKACAVEKIIQSGFYLAPDEIPKEISAVADHRLNCAADGFSTTLGAHLLAFFLLASDEALIQLRNTDPAFVEFIARLIQLRGHGNNQQINLSKDDMESLKIDVFKSIKIIGGAF